jgi:hypothetical protein
VQLRLNERLDDFNRLLLFLEQSSEVNANERPRTYNNLYSLAKKNLPAKARIFLHDIIQQFRDRTSAQSEVLEAIRELLFSNEEYNLAPTYISMFLAQDSSARPEESDFLVTAYITSHALGTKNTELLLSLDPVIDQLRNVGTAPTIGYALAYYFDMLRQNYLGRIDRALSGAREVLSIFSDDKSAQYISEDNRKRMETNARALLRRYEPKIRVVNPYKFLGRNSKVKVRYADGREIEAKFKNVQRDLVLKNCELIEPKPMLEDAGSEY